MNHNFAGQFAVLTRELAYELKEMNLLRFNIVEFEKFDVQYRKVVEKLDDIRGLLQTIPFATVGTASMSTYLYGLSRYLETFVRCSKNRRDFYNYFDDVSDPYEKSIQVYRQMVLSAGRNQRAY